MSRSAPSWVVLLGLFACNSDVLSDSAAPESTGEPASTGGSTTTGVVPTTGEPAGTSTGVGTSTTGAGSTGEPPPPDKSCEDFLKCIAPCLLSMDQECLTACADGLSPDALPKLGQLAACVGGNCLEAGVCALDPASLMDPACLACLGVGLINPNPPGCEEQAAACMMSR